MTKPVCIAIMGPDRVGKSTLVVNLHTELKKKGKKVDILHFSGPKADHNSPIDQYIQPLEESLKSSPDYIICDRFGAEVCFYEKIRRNVTISEEWANSCESYFNEKTILNCFLVLKDWEWSKFHHIIEIQSMYKNPTQWFINMKLKEREFEHHSYYEYIKDYLENRSLIECRKIESADPYYLSTIYS